MLLSRSLHLLIFVFKRFPTMHQGIAVYLIVLQSFGRTFNRTSVVTHR